MKIAFSESTKSLKCPTVLQYALKFRVFPLVLQKNQKMYL